MAVRRLALQEKSHDQVNSVEQACRVPPERGCLPPCALRVHLALNLQPRPMRRSQQMQQTVLNRMLMG